MTLLEKARIYEKEQMPLVDPQRPRFHLTGPCGWINDPNGFSTYKGEYHLFFQYYPYDNKWGPMHWGHAKSKDMITWEYLPAALAPEDEFDDFGCFSGTAMELDDGRQLLIYTGVTYKDYCQDHYGPGTVYQHQCIAFGDGVNYEKYAGNPVILVDTVPEGSSHIDFRDPKIWKEDDCFYCVVGNLAADKSGQILLYESRDCINWTYKSILSANKNRYGKMWECPDFFALEGKYVVLASPQEMVTDGYEFVPGDGIVTFIGSYDKEAGIFSEESLHCIDYGLDFYAPQTLSTADGRKIMIGWMQNWGTRDEVAKGHRFFGEMTLARELHIRDGRMIQNPVRELEAYRGPVTSYKNILLEDQKEYEYLKLDGIQGRHLDMTIDLSPADPSTPYQSFDIQLAQKIDSYFSIHYDVKESLIQVDRSHCDFRWNVTNQRTFKVRDNGGKIRLRIVMDTYSVELFVNDGEQAASTIFYTDSDAEGIRFRCDGACCMDVDAYTLDF